MELSSFRENYLKNSLLEHQVPGDPFALFTSWFAEVLDSGVEDPTAMALATADKKGRPSVRMVLLKGLDERGFIFFTNFFSRKSKEIKENPQVSLLFYWKDAQRQVRVEGHVSLLPESEADGYFFQRPVESRISAVISPQSDIIEGRYWLEKKAENFKKQYPDGPVKRPDHWGGWIMKPERYEFWQGRENRLHDRLLYHNHKGSWNIYRLAP